MNTKLLTLAVVATGATAWQASAVDLIANGSFEDHQITDPAGWQNVTPANEGTLIPSWHVTTLMTVPAPPNVDVVNLNHYNAHTGTQSIDLNGWRAGGIYQTITPTAEGDYKLSFWYAGNFKNNDFSQKTLAYSIGAVSGQVAVNANDVVENGNPSTLRWKEFTTIVHLNAGMAYDLTFGSMTDASYCGPAIDDISLVAVPEPYHYGLAGVAGLFGLVIVDRARQRKLTS